MVEVCENYSFTFGSSSEYGDGRCKSSKLSQQDMGEGDIKSDNSVELCAVVIDRSRPRLRAQKYRGVRPCDMRHRQS